MSNSTNIVIRDLTTGAGRTGLTVTLRNHLDDFVSTVATGVEISGKAGVYQFVDLPLAKYKEFINGTEDTSFGGTHGKWLPQMDNLLTKDGENVWSGRNGYSSEKTLTNSTEFTYKSWVQSAISTAVDAAKSILGKLADSNNWTGTLNIFKRIKATGGTGTSDGNWFMGRNDFMDQAPYSNYPPINSAQLCNKSWTQSEIATRIASIISGAYQESLNIVRCMPSGSEIAGSVYTSFQTALVYCQAQSPVSTKQYTILVTGEGTSGDALTHDSYTYPLTSFVKDYVHFKGLGADIKVNLNAQINTDEFKAGAVGRIVIEDLNFYSNPGDDPTTQEFENITFKNCKFTSIGDCTASFINCHFEGMNQFSSASDDKFVFTNCTGNPVVTDAHTVVISGTNQIIALSSASGSLKLSGGLNVNGGLELASISADAGAAISTSDGMLRVKINGTIVHIPYFTIV